MPLLDRIDSLFSGGKRAMLPSFDLHEGYDIRFLCDYIYFTASDGKILFIISYPCLTRKPQTASSPILPAFRRWVWSMPIFLCIILFEKTHSMYTAWSILVYHLIVELCAIALMLLKPILRILFSHLLHIPVPCDLCKN